MRIPDGPSSPALIRRLRMLKWDFSSLGSSRGACQALWLNLRDIEKHIPSGHLL